MTKSQIAELLANLNTIINASVKLILVEVPPAKINRATVFLSTLSLKTEHLCHC